MAVPDPVTPMQSVAAFDDAPVLFAWAKRLLFGRGWYLYFQGMGTAVRALLSFPRYADLVMFWPVTLSVTAFLEPNYPAPPQRRVGPYTFTVWLFTPGTGADVHIKVWRTDNTLLSPPVLGGLMAEFDIPDSLNFPFSITYYPDQNFTVPGTNIYIEVTQVGSATPGSDLRIIARVEGVS